LSRIELGSQASTIVSPPSRPALAKFVAGGDYRAVCQASRSSVEGGEGPAISLQSFYLLPEQVEIDAVLTPARQKRVREALPELAFLQFLDREPLPPRKFAEGSRARDAIRERLGLLPRPGRTFSRKAIVVRRARWLETLRSSQTPRGSSGRERRRELGPRCSGAEIGTRTGVVLVSMNRGYRSRNVVLQVAPVVRFLDPVSSARANRPTK
jgi:hypothetical protein